MNKKALLVVVILVAVLSFAGYKFFYSRIANIGGLKVSSNPKSSIFLNDKLLGKTPYDDKYPAGEYILKLIPEDTSTSAASWQKKINISPSLLTYVNRELGASELSSAGDILFLEKISDKEAQVAIFSTPDAATVVLDGQEKGVSPLVLRDVVAGEHDVAVSSPGFSSRTVRIQAVTGYKLTVEYQLAILAENNATSSSTAKSIDGATLAKPYVVIKDTPTGFLRVRSGPVTTATETAQIKPGDKYSLLGEESGWYKISYETGKDGWISARYADKME
ncbi:PEGA domain-containing protein [Candidatus Gottesmanbacteria bacterium]|nr:PEGA domain-containing protein [Candidatus Gottesmanbacteria bacterium]